MNDASGLNRVAHPRRLKRVLAALREAKQSLTAADLGTLCNLTINTAARFLRMLKDHGYPIHTRRRVNHHGATEYRLVEVSTPKQG